MEKETNKNAADTPRWHNRRKFVKTVAAGSMGAVALGQGLGISSVMAKGSSADRTDNPPIKKILMKVGCQSGGTTRENLEFKARYGVFNIDGGAPKMIPGVGWDLEDSLRKRDACEKYGISLDAYHLPLTSAGINNVAFPHIMLGKSPERDREIEMVQQMIQVASKTGVGLLNYNTTILPVVRSGDTLDPTRGNTYYHSWNYEEAVKKNYANVKTIAGDVSIDEIYERITYFLDRVLPVAEEYHVRLGNHIADPPMPASYRGIMRWNSPAVFAGIKKYAQLYDSPSHGFNLCLGTTSEGLKDPATELIPIVQWVGQRKQIFNIHLRNIKGGFNNFMEVFPDNGDVDFLKVVKALRDVDYPYMVMPDHVPFHPAPGSSQQSFAFAYGYIKALIHAASQDA
jgi:mannonate dehydratase